MIFYILLVVLVVVAVVAGIMSGRFWRDYVSGLGNGAFTLFVGAMLIGIYALVASAAPADDWRVNDKNSAQYDLQAMQLGDTSYEGRHYLFSGYIDGEPQVQYIRDADDHKAVTVRSVGTDNAYIYEDATEQPYMKIVAQDRYNSFWVPWPTYSGETYEFHVPAGSVVTGDYGVTLEDVR